MILRLFLLEKFLVVVIWLSLKDLISTIKLFYNKQPYHLVGKRHFRKRHLFIGSAVHFL